MYLINGRLTAELTFDAALERLQAQLPALLEAPPRSEEVLGCAAAFVQWLPTAAAGPLLDEDQRQALVAFCGRPALELKLERELGADSRSLRRIDYSDGPFESWQPLGLVVHVWTINDPAEMRRLLDLGVDGLVTDRGDLLKEILVERGGWPPGPPA